MHDFDEQHPRVRLLFGLVAVLIVIGGLWIASSLIWPEENGKMVILKADNTPYKMKPDDKGGMQIPHQDKLIFNTISSDGKPVTVERILPGPEQPLNAPTVQPNADPIAPIPTVVNQPTPAPQPAEAAKPEAKVAEKPPEKTPEKPVEKPQEKSAEKLVEKSAPLPVHTDAPTVAAMGRVVEAAPAKATNQPVKPPAAFDMLKGDAQPVKKPETPPVEKVAEEPAPAAAPTKEPSVKEDDDTVDEAPKSKARMVEPKKSVVIEPQDESEPAEPAKDASKKSAEGKAHFQIASFFDRPSADKALAQLKNKFADELDGAALSVATATINGGKQVFRIQGAAASAAVAGSICSGIKAKGGSCVTIK